MKRSDEHSSPLFGRRHPGRSPRVVFRDSRGAGDRFRKKLPTPARRSPSPTVGRAFLEQTA